MLQRRNVSFSNTHKGASLYHIAIVKDGIEIEPATPVEVIVELLDVADGATVTDHFAHTDYLDGVSKEYSFPYTQLNQFWSNVSCPELQFVRLSVSQNRMTALTIEYVS